METSKTKGNLTEPLTALALKNFQSGGIKSNNPEVRKSMQSFNQEMYCMRPIQLPTRTGRVHLEVPKITPEVVEKVSQDRANAFYKRRYGSEPIPNNMRVLGNAPVIGGM